MKNIIKRSTSLLLVVAMLLSFAVVVGAEPAAGTGTTGAHLMLWADTVPLEAGKVAYVPIYAKIDAAYGVGALQFNVWCDSGISLLSVTNEKDGISSAAKGSFAAEKDGDGGAQRVGWSNSTPLGWTRDAEYNLVAPTTDILVCWAVVKPEANMTAGSYGIHFGPFKGLETSKPFKIISANGETVSDEKTAEDVTMTDGAAIVYNDLPMVALTKTTFDVPTMAEQEKDSSKGNYELPKLLKIVAKDSTSNEVKLYNVYNNLTAFTFEKIEGPAIDSNGTLKVTAKSAAGDASAKVTAYAADADGYKVDSIQVSGQTISYKIRKTETGLWKASFADYKDSYLSAQGFIDKEAKGGEVSAPAQTVDTPKSISLNPKVFDKYGDIYTGPETVTAKATVALFSDSKYQNDVTSTYADYVKVNGAKLEISKELPTDVYCRLTVDVQDVATPGTMTVAEFLIKSTKPRATSAEIVLKDVKGNQYTDSEGKPLYIFTVPAPGQNPVQITIDASIFDQNENEMIGDDKPTFTVSASSGATGLGAGVTLDTDKKELTITSEALGLLDPTTEKATITVEINVTGISEPVTKTITLTKAQPVATKLSTKNGEWKDGRILPMASSDMSLPGIDETSKTPFTFLHLSVLDQYDTEITEVTYDHFALYPAVEATDGDVSNGSNTFKKTGNPAISSTYAIFAANSDGVKLEITNAWDATRKQLAVPAGPYIVEATYPNPSNAEQPLVARCVIKLTKAPVPTTATVRASTETIYVPYDSKYASSQPANQLSEVTLTAKVEDQYGDPITEGVTLAKDGNDINLYDSNDNHVIKLDNNSTAAYVSEQNGTVRISVSEDLAGYMKRNGTVVTNGELRLPVKVTVTDKDGKTLKTFEGLTAKVNVSREASALKKATVVMKQGETVVQTVTLTDTDGKTRQKTINMTSPKANTVYTFEIEYEDQYGDETSVNYISYISGANVSPLTHDDTTWDKEKPTATDKIMLTVKKDNVEGETMLEIKPLDGPTWWLNIKFAPMQFVNGNGEQYTIDKLLDTTKLSKVYNRDTWYNVIENASAVTGPSDENSKVYIKSADGGQNTEVTQKIWAEVIDKTTGQTVYDARDSLSNPAGPTASATEKAGTYIVKIFYREKEGDAPIEVCSSGEFTISPKPITIELKDVSQTITKPYDGNTNLPGGLELGPKDTVEHDRVNLIPGNLEFAQANVKLKDDGTVVSIPIRVKAGMDCLDGTDAGNYTVELENGNVKGLTGTITKKALNVYVAFYSKNWDSTATVGGYTPVLNQSDIVDGETVGVNAFLSGNALCFDSSNVGAKLVTGQASSITATLTGASAGNYKVGTITYGGVNGQDATIEQATFTIKLDQDRSITYGNEGNVLDVQPEELFVGNAPISDTLKEYFRATANVPKFSVESTTTNPQPNANGHYDQTNNGKAGHKLLKPADDTNGNYTFVLGSDYTLKVSVLQLKVDVSADKLTKTYDGKSDVKAASSDFTVTVADGYTNPSGETYSLDVTSLTYKNADAGTWDITVDAKVKVNGTVVTGTAAANYSIILDDLKGTITPKAITASMFSQKEPHPVYDGTAKTLTGKDLVGTDSGITDANGNPKSLQPGTDFTAVDVTEINADTYKMTVTGQGNYTGTARVDVKIDKFTVRGVAGEKLLLTGLTGTKATRGKTTTLYINTNVVLKQEELEKFTEEVRDHVGVLQWQPKNVPAGITVNVEPTGDFKLKVTVTVSNDIKMTDPAPQFTLELSAKFPDSAKHQNIESTEYTNYEISVTDKEQQENFKIDQGESGTYSYSQGGVQLTTSGNEGDVTWSSSNPDAATVDSNGKVTFVKPGDVTITATSSETDDYAATSDTYTLTITKGQVMITASSATMTANDPLPGFSATASGLNPKDSVSKVFQTLTATVSTDGKTAGTYRVTPNAVLKAGWDAYYDLSFVQGTLTVNPATSIIDTILPTIIAGNGCANGYANCACESFHDLDASRWYHEAIDWAYNLGLMNGTTKSTFGPNAAATRAQTWTMLARIAGQDTGRSVTWYEVGQKWAMNLGITDGTNPMGSLTREQLAAMLYRYVGSPAVNGTLTFTDSANVSTWARNAMIWAVQNGILDGVGGNRLNPKGTTTRAQAAAIFMRFSKLINK